LVFVRDMLLMCFWWYITGLYRYFVLSWCTKFCGNF